LFRRIDADHERVVHDVCQAIEVSHGSELFAAMSLTEI
jgi:hypothetical protein